MNEPRIHPEKPGDAATITSVTEQVLRLHSYSDKAKHFIIMALRRTGAPSGSLLAEKENEVVGYMAFSPVRISDSSPNWYALGPIAVLPAL